MDTWHHTPPFAELTEIGGSVLAIAVETIRGLEECGLQLIAQAKPLSLGIVILEGDPDGPRKVMIWRTEQKGLEDLPAVKAVIIALLLERQYQAARGRLPRHQSGCS
jgi:hypothetical protein